MAVAWNGSKRIAVVPVINSAVDPGFPANFEYAVSARTLYDPQGSLGLDDSLQNYIQAISYGKASIDATFFSPVVSNGPDITGAAMRSLPTGHGFTHLLAVLPHSFGQHRNGMAWWNASPLNGITAFARVALFSNPQLTFRESTGVWAMETLHMSTEFGDLYNVNPNLGGFDVMAAAWNTTHPSIHTKLAMGWITPAQVTTHNTGNQTYQLHAVGLRHPPPTGRFAAIRIPSHTNAGSFLIEARLPVDQYEIVNGNSDALPSQGVIIYQVLGELNVLLRTPNALQVNQQYTNASENLTVRVESAISGGMQIVVSRTAAALCAQIATQIDSLVEDLETVEDINERKEVLKRIGRLRTRADQLGCSIASP
jgi:hypothetical protein